VILQKAQPTMADLKLRQLGQLCPDYRIAEGTAAATDAALALAAAA